MRVVAIRQGLRQVLQWTHRLLFTAAVCLLAYCGVVQFDAWLFQNTERRGLERQLPGLQAGRRKAHSDASPCSPPCVNKNKSVESLQAMNEDVMGLLQIPRLGLSVIVIEGISKATLLRAAGHIPGTALPGEAGNVGVAAHRDTFFRALRNIRHDDIITFATLLGDYRYRVVSMRVVAPSDVAVLDSTSENQILTLVTCHPFTFVGSAPNRFIVRAERVL